MSILGLGGGYGDRDKIAILEAAGLIPSQKKEKSKELPDEVAVALNFIRLCNENMGIRGAAGVQECKLREQKLHSSQEKTFKAACDIVTNYFDSFLKTGSEQRTGLLGRGRSRGDNVGSTGTEQGTSPGEAGNGS